MLRRRHILLLALPLGLLCGCAVDSHISYVPDVLKQTAEQPAIEQPPDVAAILRGDLKAVFTETSLPSNIRFSNPVPAKLGGWDTCIKGNVTGVTGRQMGNQTFLVNIDRGKIGRRQRVDDAHWCARQAYKPI